MEKGRQYEQIGQRWIDAHNVNNWPPRRCSLVLDIVFDGNLSSLLTPASNFNMTGDNMGVEYHALMDNGFGRLWSIDWGMKINPIPEQGIIRWFQCLDNPSGAYINLESVPRESTAGEPWWFNNLSWLPLGITIHADPRFTGIIQVVPAAARYF